MEIPDAVEAAEEEVAAEEFGTLIEVAI